MAHETESPTSEQTEYQTATLPTSTRFEIRGPVFWPAVAVIVALVGLGAAFPEAFHEAFVTVQEWVANTLGWFYMLAISVILLFVIWVALSRHGSKRLGPDDSRPDYGYLSWFAMLFSAGMGIGLVFFSVAEPISHFAISVPPWSGAEPGSVGASRDAMTVTYFHWGLHAWAIYIVVGMSLGFYAYRRGLPLALRSAFYPLLRERIYGPIGDAIDVLAIVGTLFGVATSLGLGAIQISTGIGELTDIAAGLNLQLVLIAGITAIATISVVLGLTKGIRRLSLFTIGLGGVLFAFVLVVGPTTFILSGFVDTLGRYVARLPDLSFNVDLGTDNEWQMNWTLFYWGWWVSWSPFVGMFIARISRGRTLREFVAGVLIVPTVVTFLVLSVLGETAFHSELVGPGGIVEAAEENLDLALFALLQQLPLASITSVVAIVVIAVFFITSSDSGSLVDDIHASGGSLEPKTTTRVFWALVEGTTAAVLLAAGGETGLEGLQQASIASGVPLAILLLAACAGLVRAFADEERDAALVTDEPEAS